MIVGKVDFVTNPPPVIDAVEGKLFVNIGVCVE